MKLDRLTIGTGILAIAISSGCYEHREKTKSDTGNKVSVYSMDTTINDSLICLKTELGMGKRRIIFINSFYKNEGSDFGNAFNLKQYKGLAVKYQNKTIDKFISFDKAKCQNSSWDFFTVFRGDSIDNPEGFYYRNFIANNNEFILLTGYFLGCNGSFCNNGALIVLCFINDDLKRAYLLGLDRSVFNLSGVKGYIKEDELYVVLNRDSSNDFSAKNVTLMLGDSIGLLNKTSKSLTELGLFCIEK